MALYAVIVLLLFAQYITLVKCRHFYLELKSKSEQLKNFAASDDEQMKYMLEMTDTPLAKKLLVLANSKDQALLPPSGASLSPVVPKADIPKEVKKAKKLNADSWDAFLQEVVDCDSDNGRINALYSVLKRRYRLNVRQRAELMREFDADAGRARAAQLLDSFEEDV